MQYYLMGEEGEQLGSANIATLNTWIVKGWLTPNSQLQEVETGQIFTAHELPGLDFDVTVKPETKSASPVEVIPNTGHMDVIFSWFLLLTSFFACPLIGNAFGWFLADRAVKEGYPSGRFVKYLHGVAMVFMLIALGIVVYARLNAPRQ